MRRLASVAALALLAACTVRPTAPEVAARAKALGNQWAPLAAELRRAGWGAPPSGGPGLENPDCLERALGGGLFGVDVARACGAPDGTVAGVWRMHTHGRDWEQVVAP